jgi:archaellum component FlaC
MQEIIMPIAAVSSAIGLVVAGINIAKGKKDMVSEGRFTTEIKRIDGDISRIEQNMVSKEEFRNGLNRIETKIDNQGDIMRDMVKSMVRLDTLMGEWRNA